MSANARGMQWKKLGVEIRATDRSSAVKGGLLVQVAASGGLSLTATQLGVMYVTIALDVLTTYCGAIRTSG